MDDEEFIIFLCEAIWNMATGGDTPDIVTIEKELRDRCINPEDVFTL